MLLHNFLSKYDHLSTPLRLGNKKQVCLQYKYRPVRDHDQYHHPLLREITFTQQQQIALICLYCTEIFRLFNKEPFSITENRSEWNRTNDLHWNASPPFFIHPRYSLRVCQSSCFWTQDSILTPNRRRNLVYLEMQTCLEESEKLEDSIEHIVTNPYNE